jgi:hypothetical protein
MISTLGFRSLRLLTALLGVVLAGAPAVAHDALDRSPAPALQAPTTSAVTATGTVAELVVENQVTNVTQRYLALRVDGGEPVVLTGAPVDTLGDGARIEVTGSLRGDTLEVTSFVALPAARGADKSGRSTQSSTQVHGTLVVFHMDYFSEERGEYGLGVHNGATKMTPLHVAVVPDSLRPGMTVTAAGTIAADGTSLDTSRITVHAMPPAQAGPTTTSNSVLVMPIKFADSAASDPFTPAEIDQVMRTNTTSTAAYYNEVSYGQQTLSITVASSGGGWLKSASNTPTGCDFVTIGSLADAAATAAGYNVANYVNRFYVLPKPNNAGCGWVGLAYVGSPYQAYSNGVNALWVYGHELGHNFMLNHAGSVSCGSLSLSTGCTVAEYGDRFDVMGNNSSANQQMHFNATQKWFLGWIPASSVITHTSGTHTYSIGPLEKPGQSIYAVEIPVAADSRRTYWIEYRQPIGFDSAMSSFPNLGAIIHVSAPFDNPCTGSCYADDTEILDMAPANGENFFDAALLVGQTYTDSTYGVSITANSATASALSVTVSVAGGGSSVTTLGSSANPSVPGASVTFTATVTGSAPTGSVAFKADGTTLTACGGVALPAGSANSKAATCSTATLSAGTHSILATYGGDSANKGSTSATLSQVVKAASTTSTSLAAAPNPSLLGASVAFTATVAGSAPTGNVAFKADGTTLSGCGAVALPAGSANSKAVTCSAATLSAGTHSIVTTYGGDSANHGSTSATLSQVVNAGKAPSTTGLAAAPNPSVLGASVTFTATVAGTAPTGSVAFKADGTTLSGCGAVPLPAGSANSKAASCSTATLSAGTHSIIATYGGDTASNGSASASLSQTVNTVLPLGALVNGSFEIPALVASGYRYNPTASGIGWVFSGNSGIQHNGSGWGAAAAPSGTQTAFIQGTGSMSQPLTLKAGSYTLSFQAARRLCCFAPFGQHVQVSVDGKPIGSSPVMAPSTSFSSFSIPFSIATTGTHTITFAGTIQQGNTTFIDAVTVH